MHVSGVRMKSAAAKRAKHEGEESTTYVNRKALERRKKRATKRQKKAAR